MRTWASFIGKYGCDYNVVEAYLDGLMSDAEQYDMVHVFDQATLAFWVSVITYKRLSERMKKLEEAVLAVPVD